MSHLQTAECHPRGATAPLPVVQVSSDSHRIIYPFTAVGVDYFGPLYVNMGPSRRSKRDLTLNKRYGYIFTCLNIAQNPCFQHLRFSSTWLVQGNRLILFYTKYNTPKNLVVRKRLKIVFFSFSSRPCDPKQINSFIYSTQGSLHIILPLLDGLVAHRTHNIYT